MIMAEEWVAWAEAWVSKKKQTQTDLKEGSVFVNVKKSI